MLKRCTIVLTAFLVLVAFGSVPSSTRAQETLGFTIDPTMGLPGSTVAGQVDPADIQDHCVTTLEEFQSRFTDLFEGPFVSGNTMGELPQRFFPDPDDIVYENHDQMSYVLTLFALLGISANINGAAGDALPQTFVMTFIDPATLQPIGELGHFDPDSGEGSVIVPDVEPGAWPIAATCVGPIFDLDALQAGIEAGGDFLEQLGVQFGPTGPESAEFQAFAQEFLDTEATGFELIIEFVTAIGSDLIQQIVTPDALGLQFFTVLESDPETAIEDLSDAIAALVEEGTLNFGQGNGLMRILRNAARSVERGMTNPACSQIGGFIGNVEDKVADGILSPAEGEDLLFQAEHIRMLLACM